MTPPKPPPKFGRARQLAQAVALLDAGYLEPACEALRTLVAVNPQDPEAHYQLGLALEKSGQVQASRASFAQAVAVDKDFAKGWYRLGNASHAAGELAGALQCYQRAAVLSPATAVFHFNCAVVLRQLNRCEDARLSYQRVIALDSTHADAHYNLGNLLRDAHRSAEAVPCYERALALRPLHAESYLNLAAALGECGRLAEVAAVYTRALALLPRCSQAHLNQALHQLLLGDFAAGWAGYEARLNHPPGLANREFEAPPWRGDWPLTKRTLLVYAEQGLGDFLQFYRYVPALLARGARVILEVPTALVPLLPAPAPGLSVLPVGATRPPFDGHCALLSLPLAFGTRLSSIPAAVPYLSPPPALATQWRARLGVRRQWRVGLVWFGNPQHANDRNRSIALELLEPLLALPVAFHSLHNQVRPADLPMFARHPEICRHESNLLDFAHTAALIDTLDLVISVDTSVAHLAGALAKPLWVLLPYVPDFRWLLTRTDSPWYPTARLFRQPTQGDWHDVVARVGRALLEMTQATQHPPNSGGLA